MALINPAILLDPPCEPGCPRKRRRLDNLTPEERALRRKLKNRVAAQTARDRKKARMTELEESLAIFEQQNKKLLKENKDLKLRASTLENENNELKSRLGLTPPSSPTLSEDVVPSVSPLPSPPHSPTQDDPAVVVVKQEKESTEYAELGVSRQKEQSPILFLSLLTTTVLLNLLSLMSYSAFLKISKQLTQKNLSPSNKSLMTYSSSVQETQKSPSLKKNEETKNYQMEWGKQQNAWNPPQENS